MYHTVLRPQTRAPLVAIGQHIGHFPEGGLHGFFVLGQGDALVGLRHLQPSAQPPPRKNGQMHGGGKIPGAAGPGKQRIQCRTAAAGAGRQADRGEKRRPRGTNVGVLGDQSMLSGLHIGAGQQDAGGQRLRQRRPNRLGWRLQPASRWEGLCRQRRPHQQLQRIAAAGQLGGVQGHIAPGGFHRAQVLRQRQARGRAQLEHAAHQGVRLFPGVQGLLGQRQALLVGGQGQPGIGHLGNQGNFYAPAVFLHLQKLLPGRRIQVANAAPQIHLVAGKANAGADLLIHQAGAVADIGAAAAALALQLGGDAGQLIGPGDAVLGAGLGHVVGGDAQIAVVVQRQGNGVAQAVIGQPLQRIGLGGRQHGWCKRWRWCGIWHRGRNHILRLLIAGSEVAA